MNGTTLKQLIISTALCIAHPLWAADVDVGSREYKILLDPSAFTGNATTRATKVNDYWNDLKNVIENDSIERNTSGNLSLEKTRTVAFFDVQGSCDLYNNNYTFRERVENTDREVTLKFRSADRFIASKKDMDGTESGWESKFEEDLATPFVSKYSYSTKQEIGSSKNLNKLDDPIGLYLGLEDENLDDTLDIEKVSGLTVNEYVYRNASVDLGALDAEFSLTLWYNETVTTTLPIVAEISYKYEDTNEGFSNNVVTRAKELFTAMQTHSSFNNWNAQNSLTKTATIYQYNSNFCN
ncbi:hypothetical protein NBRC116188_09870 [Oceaniserpentilla sp. 4NH20-0058]|uniref:hypothetical protein n=1 Tax=Oceaniserpentilla sp. 4NH20-0058 TaxID=3127660 RepID=UPI003109814A